MLSFVVLSVFRLSDILLSVVMLGDISLNVIILIVVMLSTVYLNLDAECYYVECWCALKTLPPAKNAESSKQTH